MTDSSSQEQQKNIPPGLIKTGRVLFAIVFVALVVSNVMLQREVRLLRTNLRASTLTLLHRGSIQAGVPLPRIGLLGLGGRKTTLLELSAATPLILFVDPECSSCKALIAEAGKDRSSRTMAFVSVPRPGSPSLLKDTPASSEQFSVSPIDDTQLRHLIGRVPRVLLAGNGRVVRLCDTLSECLAPVVSATNGQPL